MTTATLPRHARPPAARPPSRFARLVTLLKLACHRAAWVASLFRLGLFLLFHLSAPVPTGPLNVRVLAAPRGMRLDDLDMIAAAYRTRVTKRYGCLVAERRFGPHVVVAHVTDDDYTSQLAARMGTGATGNEAAA